MKPPARIGHTIARVLLGLIFLAAGLSGFYLVGHPPPLPPGDAGAFMTVFFRTRYVLFVDGIEAICGALLLADRFVPLALVTLAGILTNIVIFHLTMMPAGFPPAIVVIALWFAVAWPMRALFAPIFKARN